MKQARRLKPGDVVDWSTITPNRFPLRTVKEVENHPIGIPEPAVILHWEETTHTNTVVADKVFKVISSG